MAAGGRAGGWFGVFEGSGAGVNPRRGTGDPILEQGKLRRTHRTKSTRERVDLGDDAPLFVGGGSHGGLDRRRISVHWFSGTILTGFCGAALMGGAVYAALDGEARFAAEPERVETSLRGSLTASGERAHSIARKTDRLPQVGEANAARQVIRVSTTSRVGERELVRVRPFVRIASNLSLSTSDLSANIPPYNPTRILTESAGGTTAAGEDGPEPDVEVSLMTRDLGPVLVKARLAAVVPLEDVIARVRDTSEWSGNAKPIATVVQPGTRLAYAAEGSPDPYIGFEARIVPENITLLPKTASQASGGNNWNERAITLKKGDTLAGILRELGATADEITTIAAMLGPRGREGGLREGHKLRVLLSPAGPGQRLQVVRIAVMGDSMIEAVVALSDAGRYVSVDVRTMETAVAETEEEEDDSSGVRLYQSVYETALRNQVPRPLIDELIRIYSYDVDFQRKVQPGDSFEVLYSGDDDSSGDVNKGEVLFAALTVGGEPKKYYRFQTPDDGVVDYYDESGKSAKKFLVRKPVLAGTMRSGFGMRRHPILGYSKMHTGVDWAAPRGTPIYASGNGTVEKSGWESGYGKYIRIRHTNGYETAYAHMSAFARNMAPGTRVRQGQVIGYVGSTGLSTGAHLHYEILVNGRFVDPMRIRLPRGRSLEGTHLANFERERDRLDNMISRPRRVAQTGSAR